MKRSVSCCLLVLVACALATSGCKKSEEEIAAEAEDNLKRIAEGAMAYYQDMHDAGDGSSITKIFPAAEGKVCTTTGGAGSETQAPEPSDFAAGTAFKTLGFSLDKPHYYRYCYEHTGGQTPGLSQAFVATAEADLDDDGQVDSAYKLTGSVAPSGAPQLSSITKEK